MFQWNFSCDIYNVLLEHTQIFICLVTVNGEHLVDA